MSLFLFMMPCHAQKSAHVQLSGKVSDRMSQPVAQATVQLLSIKDAALVAGIATDNDGKFIMEAETGSYTLRITYVGYKPFSVTVELRKAKYMEVVLEEDEIALSEAIVTAKAPAIQVVEDTVVFNSSSYKVQVDAMAEDLVKKIPGADIDGSKNITIHGKTVKRLLVNGKEFFGDDVKSGLRSIPADLIEQIRTYERQSDLARLSGVDDGEEELVLDLVFKPDAQHGYSGNVSAASGTRDRYFSRANINRFSDMDQLTITGSLNNVNDRTISPDLIGEKSEDDSQNGLFDVRNLGMSYAKHTDRMELGGHVAYRYIRNTLDSESTTQNLQSAKSTFSSSNLSQRRRNEFFSSELRLEYKFSETLRMVIRPSLSFTSSSVLADRMSGSFMDDPYLLCDNPNLYLDTEEIENEDPLRELRQSNSRNKSHSTAGNFKSNIITQLSKRFSKKGRSLSLQLTAGNGTARTDVSSDIATRYYRIKSNPDSISYVRRFTHTPSSYWNLSAQLTYNEPIAKNIYIQFRYRLQYRCTSYEKSVYDIGDVDGTWTFLDALPDNYCQGFNDNLSKSSKYQFFQHQINVNLRVNKKKLSMTAGVNFQPQASIMSYRNGDFMTDTVRHMSNFAPQIEMRYRFSKSRQLRLTYRGRPSQPSMERLLPTVDNTNPLNIKIGNPGLKPSFTHAMEMLYNSSDIKSLKGLIVSANLNIIENAQSNSTTYDETTGGRTQQMQNINGNWNARTNVNYTTTIFDRLLELRSNSVARYSNQVSNLYNKECHMDERNRISDLTLGEDILTTWRNSDVELNLKLSARYNAERSKLEESDNEDPYILSYGFSATTPILCGIVMTSFIDHQFQGGYRDEDLNRTYLIWNLQLSRKFGRHFLLSADFYDMLHQMSSIQRVLTAERRQVSLFNNINSYCLFRLTYKI